MAKERHALAIAKAKASDELARDKFDHDKGVDLERRATDRKMKAFDRGLDALQHQSATEIKKKADKRASELHSGKMDLNKLKQVREGFAVLAAKRDEEIAKQFAEGNIDEATRKAREAEMEDKENTQKLLGMGDIEGAIALYNNATPTKEDDIVDFKPDGFDEYTGHLLYRGIRANGEPGPLLRTRIKEKELTGLEAMRKRWDEDDSTEVSAFNLMIAAPVT